MIIYIVGYGRSGSTVLSELIEEKLEAINLGEVKFLYRNEYDDLLDEYWLEFKAINKCLLSSQGHKLKWFDSIFGIFSWHKKKNYKELWDEIFNRVGLDPDKDIIIDNSKTTLDSFMRGIYLNACYQDVYFLYPQRSFIKVLKSILKGKNPNLERGVRRNFFWRLLHTFFVGFPHLLITRLLSMVYKFLGMYTINLNNIESEIDEFILKEDIKPLNQSTHTIPMIYGNRSRNKKRR